MRKTNTEGGMIMAVKLTTTTTTTTTAGRINLMMGILGGLETTSWMASAGSK